MELEPGHIVQVERKLACSVLRNGGDAEGTLGVVVQTDDDATVAAETQTLSWNVPVEENGMNAQMIAIGGGGLLLVAAAVALLMFRSSENEEVIHDEDGKTRPTGPPVTVQSSPESQTPVQGAGPPVSVQRGPPLPSSGLPAGWTMDQWEHYGQQWIDQQNTSNP